MIISIMVFVYLSVYLFDWGFAYQLEGRPPEMNPMKWDKPDKIFAAVCTVIYVGVCCFIIVIVP